MTYRDADAPLTAEEHYLALHRLLDEAVASYDLRAGFRLESSPVVEPGGLQPPKPDKPHGERRGGQRRESQA